MNATKAALKASTAAHPAVVTKAAQASKANGKTASAVKPTGQPKMSEAEVRLHADMIAAKTQGELVRAILAHRHDTLALLRVKDAATQIRVLIASSGSTVKVTDGALSMYISDGLGTIAAIKQAGRWK